VIGSSTSIAKRYPQINFDGCQPGPAGTGSGVLAGEQRGNSVIEETKKMHPGFDFAQALRGWQRRDYEVGDIALGAFSAVTLCLRLRPVDRPKFFPEVLDISTSPRPRRFFSSAARGRRAIAPTLDQRGSFNNDEV